MPRDVEVFLTGDYPEAKLAASGIKIYQICVAVLFAGFHLLQLDRSAEHGARGLVLFIVPGIERGDVSALALFLYIDYCRIFSPKVSLQVLF